MLRVLGINASPHKEGTCARILSQVLAQAAQEGADTTILHLVDIPMTFYHGDLGVKEVSPELRGLIDVILSAQAIIFSWPTYWFGINDRMASLLAHLTPLEDNRRFPSLEGRVFGLIATCGEDGAAFGLARVGTALSSMGMVSGSYCSAFYNTTMVEKIEEGWHDTDLALMVTNLIRIAKSVVVEKDSI